MIDTLEKAARAGGEILLKYFRTDVLDVTHKTDHHNIVTQADTESQEAITRAIIEGMKNQGVEEKDIGFIGEENLHTHGSHIFVIDPLDGTSNFAGGLDYFCIPIAYFKNGVHEASVLYHPTHDVMYSAEKGAGAYVQTHGEKRPLIMTAKPKEEMFISTYFEAFTETEMKLLPYKLLPYFRGIRGMGAGALDIIYVAENRFGVLLERGFRLWDIAGSKLILEEAGGKIYGWDGEEVKLNLDDREEKYYFVACHPAHKDFIFNIINS